MLCTTDCAMVVECCAALPITGTTHTFVCVCVPQRAKLTKKQIHREQKKEEKKVLLFAVVSRCVDKSLCYTATLPSPSTLSFWFCLFHTLVEQNLQRKEREKKGEKTTGIQRAESEGREKEWDSVLYNTPLMSAKSASSRPMALCFSSPFLSASSNRQEI